MTGIRMFFTSAFATLSTQNHNDYLIVGIYCFRKNEISEKVAISFPVYRYKELKVVILFCKTSVRCAASNKTYKRD
jgi:hypothetical protein